jgi:serine/threonine protein kinase
MIILESQTGRYRFNPYDRSTHIGRGGMGVVFKGEDLKTSRPVAVKVLYNSYSSNNQVLAKTVLASKIRIRHQNVVEILDFIEKDGKYHTVCEFLDGVTLDKMIREGGLATHDQSYKLEVIKSILDGVEILHSNDPKIIHRDLTPANIMVCRNGRIVIMDFGIARIQKADMPVPKMTIVNNGFVLGTYYYSPPEQITGNFSAINETSDIYTLGITFYELFVGRPPFVHDNPMHLMQMQMTTPIPYHERIQKHIFKTLQKATAKDPKMRYQTINEFRDAFLKKGPSWLGKIFG